jgi:hypothetical protein
MRICVVPLPAFLIFLPYCLLAQDSAIASNQHLSQKYLNKVSAKAGSIESKPDKQSEKALNRLQKQERKIKSNLMKKYSAVARNVCAGANSKYKVLQQRLTGTRPVLYFSKPTTPGTVHVVLAESFTQLSVKTTHLAKENPILVNKRNHKHILETQTAF